jgi:CheY-like chemotaxis protein
MARILIVEDEVLQRTLLGTHFKARGHEIVCAADAVDALQALLCETFDVILSDIRMPYLDGIEFLQAVRGDVRTCDLPLVFLTGKSDEKTRQRAIRAGATAFLAKPCSMALLDETIDRLLEDVPVAMSAPPVELVPVRRRRYA